MTPACPFCLENKALQDVPLFENNAFFVLGMIPQDRKHAVMIVLKRHVETPFDIAAKEWAEMPGALAFAKAHLSSFRPSGYTIGWNVGPDGGQTVAHVHLHVICRFHDEPSRGHGLNGLIRAANHRSP